MAPLILIVEDESDLAATCQRLLSRHGWTVAIAGSAAEALIVLARPPRPVLAIVDRQLPDGDGIEVLRAARPAGTPVIMVTGYGTSASRRLALDEGAVAFLAKPFSMQELLNLVRTIVGEGPGPARARRSFRGPPTGAPPASTAETAHPFDAP
jgi:DNA-binding response OmpR family regulator